MYLCPWPPFNVNLDPSLGASLECFPVSSPPAKGLYGITAMSLKSHRPYKSRSGSRNRRLYLGWTQSNRTMSFTSETPIAKAKYHAG